MGNPITIRLAQLGKTQRWLLDELAKRGMRVSNTEMCQYKSGLRTPKAIKVLRLVDEILTEYELKGEQDEQFNCQEFSR